MDDTWARVGSQLIECDGDVTQIHPGDFGWSEIATLVSAAVRFHRREPAT